LIATDRWRRGDRGHLFDHTNGLGLISDCRLDNRVELGRELGADASASDSTLLRMAWERWGGELGGHLIGDFALVVWDEKRCRLTAFRDPLGIKPIYYARTQGGMAVASDVDLLTRLARPPARPDDLRIVEHLLWDYRTVDRTFWESIRRLPGGHVLTADASTDGVRRYWAPRADPQASGDLPAVCDRFGELFRRSVRRRIDADRPIVAHLSGGVDSSLIVCTADLICRDLAEQGPSICAVSERYPGMNCDEGEYIDAVAQRIRLPHEEWSALDAGFEDLDAPAASGPSMRTQRTSGSAGDLEIARRLGAQVVLSGLGGDQLGSTAGLRDDLLESRLPSHIWEALRGRHLTVQQRTARLLDVVRLFTPMPWRRARATRRYVKALPSWLQPRWRDLAATLSARAYQQDLSFDAHVQNVHWGELTSGRVGLGIDLEQRCASAAGAEVRYPFLDQELVQFVLSVPPRGWPAPGSYARLHREAMGDALPDAIRLRTTKVGFSQAMAQRVRRAADRLGRLISSGPWASEPWVDRAAAKQLLERVIGATSPPVGESHAVWRMGALEAWLRRVFS
jgi:asparagine synthase (glutamine-hydrolysing)